MAYLPSDVLKRLAEEAAKGNDAAQNVLKKSGNEDMIKAPVQNTVQPVLDNPVQPLAPAQPVINWDVQTLTNPNYDPYTEQKQDVQQSTGFKEKVEDVLKLSAKGTEDRIKSRKQLEKEIDKSTEGVMYSGTAAQLSGEEVLDHVDKQSAKFAPNAKYKVNLVDSSNVNEVNSNDIELWYIDDKRKGFHQGRALDGSFSIGSDNLEGAQAGADYVIYNKNTKQIYQYAVEGEDTDNLAKLKSAEDSYNKFLLSSSQSGAELEARRNSCIDRLYRKCDEYGIDLNSISPDNDKFSLLEPLFEEYDLIQSEIRKHQSLTDHTMEVKNNYITSLKSKAPITKAITAQEFSEAQYIVNRYHDTQLALSGGMTTKEYKDLYKCAPTTADLNSLAVKAKDAQYIVDNAGLICDIGSVQTTELNEYANGYKEMEYNFENSLVGIAANGDSNGKYLLDMSNNYQINSPMDAIRKLFVALSWDSPKAEDKLNAFKEFSSDLKKCGKLFYDTLTDTEHYGPLRGTAGLLLNTMSDYGEILFSGAAAMFNAYGFRGKEGYQYLDPNTGEMKMWDNMTRYGFADGALNNQEYYFAKADTRDYLTGLEEIKAKVTNMGVAFEAQMRGDMTTFSAFNTHRLYNGEDTTEKFVTNHPILSTLIDVGISILFDPTTYTSAFAATKLSDTKAVQDLVDDNFDAIVAAARKSDININAETEKQIKAILGDSIETSLSIRGAKGLEDEGVIRAMDAIMGDPEAVKALYSIGDGADSVKAYMLKELKFNVDSELARIAGTDEQLWKDAYSAAKTIHSWKQIDKALNDFQMGLIPELFGSVKEVINSTKQLILFKNKAGLIDDMSDAVSNFFIGLLKNTKKAFDGGIDAVPEYAKLTKSLQYSAISDTVATALKKGEDAGEVIRKIYEMNKLTDTTRVNFVRSVVSDTFDKVIDAVNASHDITKISELVVDYSDLNTLRKSAHILNSNLTITDEVLAYYIRIISNGKYKKYSDYVKYLYSISDAVDVPDITNSVRHTIDNYVNKLENKIIEYNKKVSLKQYEFIDAVVTNNYFTDENLLIISKFDVTNIAPELKTKFDDCVDLISSKSITSTNKATKLTKEECDYIKSVIGEYHKALEDVYGKKVVNYYDECRRIDDLIGKHKYEAMSADDFIDLSLAKLGIYPSDNDISKICRDTTTHFDDVQKAGKYYVIQESQETNLNGILNNKALSDLIDDKDSLYKAYKIIDDPNLYTFRFDNKSISSFQRELFTSLTENMDEGAYVYHMLMDSIAGNSDEVNRLFREFRKTDSVLVREDYVRQIVELVSEHSNDVHRYCYGKNLIDDTTSLYRAFYNLCSTYNPKYSMLIPDRNSVYNTLVSANNKLYDVLNSVCSSEEYDIIKAIISQFEKAIEEGKYTTKNSDMGKIFSSDLLDNAVKAATNGDVVHVDMLKAIMDNMKSFDSELSFGLSTLIDADHTAQYISGSSISKAMHAGNATTRELADYTKVWDILYNNLKANASTVPSVEALTAYRNAILAQADKLRNDVRYAQYFDYLSHVKCTDQLRATAVLLDAEARLGVDKHVTGYLLNKVNPAYAEMYTALKDIAFDGVSKARVTGRVIDLNNNDILTSALARADAWDELYTRGNYSCNKLAVRTAVGQSLCKDDAVAQLLFDSTNKRAQEIYDTFNKFNDDKGLKGRALAEYRRRQYTTLRGMEDTIWDNSRRNIMSMSRDSFDSMLITSGCNACVCDESIKGVSQFIAKCEQDGYIITRTQLSGKDVTLISLNFDELTDARKQALRVHTGSGATYLNFSVQAGFDADTVEAVHDAYNRTETMVSGNFSESVGAKVDMTFYETVQNLLPQHCRLSADFKNMHTTNYVSNMLCNIDTAQEIGAVRGHMLGNFYYSATSALESNAMMDDISSVVAAQSNTLSQIAHDCGCSPKLFAQYMKEANYHVVDTRVIDDVSGYKRLGVHDYTDELIELTKGNGKIYDYLADERHISKRIRNDLAGTWDDYIMANNIPENAIVVDDMTYKLLNGEVNATNKSFIYAMSPRLVQKTMDIADSARSAYITSQLYLSNIKGTGFRNIIDSNIKALNELNHEDLPKYLDNYIKCTDYQNIYIQKMTEVYAETGMRGTDAIYKYCTAHPEEDMQTLQKWHTVFTLSETADDDLAKAFRAKRNDDLLNKLSFKPTQEDKDTIIKIFESVRDDKFRWVGAKGRTDTEEYRILVDTLKKKLKCIHHLDYEDQIMEIAKLYGDWSTGNVSHWYNKAFDTDNKLGMMLSHINKTTFDNAEIRCRNAMLLTLMDNGESSVSANARVVKTQFDYGTSKGLKNTWDKFMPFSKYQFSNAAYWLDNYNYSAAAVASARRLARSTHYYDTGSIVEEAKRQAAYKYIKDHNTDTEDYEKKKYQNQARFLDSINNVIENYKGTQDRYGLDIDDVHYLKLGNGLIDTMEWVSKCIAAPIEISNGEIPTILKDTVFSPLRIGVELKDKLVAYINNPYKNDNLEALSKFAGANYYDLFSMIPVFGALANIAISSAKNFTANKGLMMLAMSSTEISKHLIASIADSAAALGATLMPSVIGTHNVNGGKKVYQPSTDENGVRHTWSELTEEEKANYIFVPGISNDFKWACTPSKLFGLKGRLAVLGLNESELDMLFKDSTFTNPSIMYDDNGKLYIDQNALEATVLDMLEYGYTVDEIKYLLTTSTAWYNVNTHSIVKTSAELERELINQAILTEYNTIPDYIKYQPDMYKELMAQYKALGYNTREAWMLMRIDNTYLDEHGCMRTLSSDGAAAYTKWLRDEYYEGQKDDGFLEWYAQLPDYIQYEKGAYSRTLAYLKQMFSDEEAKQMIVNGAYYTADGRLINCKDLHRAAGYTNTAFQDAQGYWHKEGDFQVNGYWFHKGDNPYLGYKDFNDYYKHLPAYTQYTKGCFKTTNTVLKSAGFDYNTRMQAMLDGAIAMEIDPNSEAFKGYLAKQQIVAVTKTVYVDKQVPLRECSLVDGKWQWNGPQVVKVTNLGNGYTTEQVTKEMEFNAAGMGLTTKPEWKSYDSAMVTVQVAQTVVTAEQDPNQIMYRIVQHDGKTYIIVPAPEYNPPRRNYYKKGSPKEWTKRRKPNSSYEKVKRVKGKLPGYNNQPMHIKYSNVRTYSKQHFIQQQGVGYEYWTQWGDGRMTNHRNRNGRMNFPSTYRNPRSRQRNMYRDLYGKFGASRMNQRQNIAGYSNASITRLRRNDVANRSYNIKVNSARV